MTEELVPQFDVFALRTFRRKTLFATQELIDKLGGCWEHGTGPYTRTTCEFWMSPSFQDHDGWLDGTCTAECRRSSILPSRHEAPHEDCECGIYGSLSYADLLDQFRTHAQRIVAVISAEGKTIIGERGLKTQFARVVAYWVRPDESLDRLCAADQFRDAKAFDNPLEMIEEYGLALLPPADAPKGGGSDWWTGRGSGV